LNESSEEEIYNQSKVRLEEVMRGTGAVEIKSGYGLTLRELKMLHVIKRLSQNYPVAIKATFLAHAFPLEYKDNHQGYIDTLMK
jgi:imidazolonepropionase